MGKDKLYFSFVLLQNLYNNIYFSVSYCIFTQIYILFKSKFSKIIKTWKFHLTEYIQ